MDAKVTAHDQQTGFLRSGEDLGRGRNTEAYAARKAAEGQGAALLEAQEELDDLTSQLETVKTEAVKVAGLQTQVTTLTTQPEAARAQAAKPEEAAALKVYRDAVGNLLPEGLASVARKSLLEAGFVGKQFLARVPDEELRALNGATDGTIKALHKFAPVQAKLAPMTGG